MTTRRTLVWGAALVALAAALYARRAASHARLHPELRSPVLRLRTPSFTPGVVALMRRLPGRATPPTDVRYEEVAVPGPPGAPDVPVLLYRPLDGVRSPAAVLFIHGGGYVVGSAAASHAICARWANELGVLVANVEYRLAPDTPFPGPLEDCYAALRWLKARAADLGVDPTRLAIAGQSAGGGLAAALAQLAHDRGEVEPAFQLLFYPMIDDRTVLRADHGGRGEFVWTPGSNRLGWTSYLGRPPTPDGAPEYAAPARRADLSGLAPAWIGVGTLDLFHREDEKYARRLQAAGVPCEFVEVEGAYHASEMFAPNAPVSAAFAARATAALGRGLGLD